MPRPKASRPTDGELEILRILWQSGPATVRGVHHAISRSRNTGYTSVLKLMQIMTEKGLLLRDEQAEAGTRAGAHVYRAAVSQQHTQRHLIRDLIDRAFGGSARALVLQALSSRKSSPRELAEIRTLLDELERGNR